MTEEKKIMEEDLFVNNFIHYLDLKIKNSQNPEIITEYKFGFKEIDGMESDRISNSAAKLDPKTGEIKMRSEEANVKYIKSCLVEAPFPITEDNIRKLNKKTRDALLRFATKINSLATEELTESDVEKK